MARPHTAKERVYEKENSAAEDVLTQALQFLARRSDGVRLRIVDNLDEQSVQQVLVANNVQGLSD